MLKHGLGKAVLLSLWMLAGIAGLFSCDSDQANGHGRKGALRLSLLSDTTGIKGGLISTKSGNEFDEFLHVDDYMVQIVAEDTLTSLLYKDFPEQLPIEEGNYTLVASKGENLPAAFENPYFEGSREFTIKEDMKTPLEVTCTMANARIKAEYSEDFLKAYTDYTVMLKTSKLDNPFLISKEETRFAYLQTDKEGQNLTVAISLKRATWTEAKVYTVTDQAIKLSPKETVTLKFSTDGKTGDGLDLSIVLDDRLTEVELKDTVPDFMWKPFEKPTLLATHFENKELIEISSAGLDVSPYLAFGVPSGIGGFAVWRTEVGSTDTIKYDIATSAGATAAKNAGFDWKGVDLFNYKKNGQLMIEEALKKLPYIGDKEYEFIFFIKDNLPVTNYTDTVQLFVHKVYAAPVIKQTTELPANGVLEGEALKENLVANLEAEGGIKDVIVSLKDAEGKETKYNKDQLSTLGGTLTLTEDETKGTLMLPKEFTKDLNALEDGDQTFEIGITVDAKEGIESAMSRTLTNTLLIKCPKFEWAMAPNEGDVFAKRAILKANVIAGISSKLKFQKKEGNDWVDISSTDRAKDGTMVIDTWKGINPVTRYTVRAIYDNGKNRVSEEYSFTTEGLGVLPNAGFENWYIQSIAHKVFGITTLTYYNYFPYKENETNKWWSTNNSRSMDWTVSPVSVTTCPAVSYVKDVHSGNKAAEIRTTAGSGYAHTSSILYSEGIVRGTLLIGNYTWDKDTESITPGRSFNSRPSKLSFWYKYTPYNTDEFEAYYEIQNRESDETKILSSGSFKKSASTPDSEYQNAIIHIAYNITNLKATHIYIKFVSTTKDKPEAQKKASVNLIDAQNNWTAHIGSRLKIDDVELIYE